MAPRQAAVRRAAVLRGLASWGRPRAAGSRGSRCAEAAAAQVLLEWNTWGEMARPRNPGRSAALSQAGTTALLRAGVLGSESGPEVPSPAHPNLRTSRELGKV